MTVVVKESADSMAVGLTKMKTAMIEDYAKFMQRLVKFAR